MKNTCPHRNKCMNVRYPLGQGSKMSSFWTVLDQKRKFIRRTIPLNTHTHTRVRHAIILIPPHLPGPTFPLCFPHIWNSVSFFNESPVYPAETCTLAWTPAFLVELLISSPNYANPMDQLIYSLSGKWRPRINMIGINTGITSWTLG